MVMPIIQYAPETCNWCEGNGRWGEYGDVCHICGGLGSVMVAQPPRKCPECNGKGSVGEFMDRCPICNGAGWAHVLPSQSQNR